MNFHRGVISAVRPLTASDAIATRYPPSARDAKNTLFAKAAVMAEPGLDVSIYGTA